MGVLWPITHSLLFQTLTTNFSPSVIFLKLSLPLSLLNLVSLSLSNLLLSLFLPLSSPSASSLFAHPPPHTQWVGHFGLLSFNFVSLFHHVIPHSTNTTHAHAHTHTQAHTYKLLCYASPQPVFPPGCCTWRWPGLWTERSPCSSRGRLEHTPGSGGGQSWCWSLRTGDCSPSTWSETPVQVNQCGSGGEGDKYTACRDIYNKVAPCTYCT